MRRYRFASGLALSVALSACTTTPTAPLDPTSLDNPAVTAALSGVSADHVKQHMTVLADDKMEGRGLGSAGYEAALQYVERTLTSYKLTPAGEGGGFRQRVPLRNNIVVKDKSSMTVHSPSGNKRLVYGTDVLMSADPLRKTVSIDNAPVAFVGYGVSAPKLGYDDYASGIDVRGKVVALLSGAPASLPSNERAYYSSGAVKEAEAIKRGAIGILTFTSPDDPRFRWDVSVATGAQGSYAWINSEGQPNRGDAQMLGSANLNHSGAQALLAGAPRTPADIFAAAAKSTPQAFDLATRISMTTESTHQDVDSANVVAKLEGSDPALKNEHVVYIAHVDHFGRGVAMNGDDIYNGAHDNASGVAIVLEIARTFAALPEKPRRSIVFLFVTAEERGLLGSDYFARHPTVPANSIVADLTLDMPFLFHPLLDIVPYGAQHSTLSGPVTRAAQHLGIEIATDPIPEQVLFIRSDHYSFVRQGVPSLFIKSGFKTGDARDGGAINAAYRRDVYHKPNDDMSQSFDFGAGAAHAKVNFLTGWLVAQDAAKPQWNPGDFFGQLFSRQTGTQ
ncbi:MAG TPA: M28 family metallopeptidase [Vicinamibacterales bacterium]|nr:M28 family metallopeptidase [Vicinamibacterales bacterium]